MQLSTEPEQKGAVMPNILATGLAAAGPAEDRAREMELYGWLVGQWTIDAVRYSSDGQAHRVDGTIWAGWVLEGRAVQDVWAIPGVFHGTTLRVYDPGIDAWHIIWSDPLKQYHSRQIGRRSGKDIVQEGTNDAGELLRWSFTDIRADSFRWLGECSRDRGASWITQIDMRIRRT